MKNIYSSIDIGSDTIKIVVCELYKNKLNLLAAASTKSKGIKRGLITDAALAKEAIKQCFNQVESIIGIKITKVIATIPSYFSEFKIVKDEIRIEHEDNNLITGDDISKLFKNINNSIIGSSNEIVTILPIDFTVNNQDVVKDPKGMIGKTLSVRAIVPCTPRKNILSVVGLLEELNIEVVDISISGISDIYALKDSKIDEEMGVLINIGYETTNVSIYNKGLIVKNSIIGLGGQNIDNDLSYIYKINITDAIKIKEKLALAHKMYANVNDTVKIKNVMGDDIVLNQYETSQIVSSRISEILELVKKEIKILSNYEPSYIIVTGGTSNIKQFNIIADEVLGKGTIIGDVKLLGIRNNKYITALGSILYFINKMKLKGKEYSMFNRNEIEYISRPQKNSVISNDSMIGKVLGYFFNE